MLTRSAKVSAEGREGMPRLSARQRDVLRATVRAYVGEAAPIASRHIAHLLPEKLSSASIRATLAELGELGLVQQPHASAGRVPTEEGLRLFIDCLLDPGDVAEYDRRTMEFEVDTVEGDAVLAVATQLLSERTRLLGFAVAPRLERVRLQHVSLVRLSSGRVLAVLVSNTGAAYRRALDADATLGQRELDRAAALLNERVVGRTLRQVRDSLLREAAALRQEADRLLRSALELGVRAAEAQEDEADVVVATRLAFLDQPEFRDPRRLREIFETLETRERLADIVEEMLCEEGVHVKLGGEVGDPALSHCAVVAAHYGEAMSPLGAVGVIGPSRMDYSRVIPLVAYCSRVMTEKLRA